MSWLKKLWYKLILGEQMAQEVSKLVEETKSLYANVEALQIALVREHQAFEAFKYDAQLLFVSLLLQNSGEIKIPGEFYEMADCSKYDVLIGRNHDKSIVMSLEETEKEEDSPEDES